MAESGDSALTANQWQPGQSANPLGPGALSARKRLLYNAQDLALSFVPRAFEAIMEIAENARDPKTRLMAYGMILDRSLGKPAQRQEHTGEGGGPITVTIGVKEPTSPIQRMDLPITPLISTTPDE